MPSTAIETGNLKVQSGKREGLAFYFKSAVLGFSVLPRRLLHTLPRVPPLKLWILRLAKKRQLY